MATTSDALKSEKLAAETGLTRDCLAAHIGAWLIFINTYFPNVSQRKKIMSQDEYISIASRVAELYIDLNREDIISLVDSCRDFVGKWIKLEKNKRNGLLSALQALAKASAQSSALADGTVPKGFPYLFMPGFVKKAKAAAETPPSLMSPFQAYAKAQVLRAKLTDQSSIRNFVRQLRVRWDKMHEYERSRAEADAVKILSDPHVTMVDWKEYVRTAERNMADGAKILDAYTRQLRARFHDRETPAQAVGHVSFEPRLLLPFRRVEDYLPRLVKSAGAHVASLRKNRIALPHTGPLAAQQLNSLTDAIYAEVRDTAKADSSAESKGRRIATVIPSGSSSPKSAEEIAEESRTAAQKRALSELEEQKKKQQNLFHDRLAKRPRTFVFPGTALTSKSKRRELRDAIDSHKNNFLGPATATLLHLGEGYTQDKVELCLEAATRVDFLHKLCHQIFLEDEIVDKETLIPVPVAVEVVGVHEKAGEKMVEFAAKECDEETLAAAIKESKQAKEAIAASEATKLEPTKKKYGLLLERLRQETKEEVAAETKRLEETKLMNEEWASQQKPLVEVPEAKSCRELCVEERVKLTEERRAFLQLMKRTGTLYRKSLAPSATVRQEVAKAEGAEGKSDTATAQLLTERVATKMLRTTPPAQKAVASASSVLGSFESRLAHPPSQVQASESRVGPMKRAPAHGSGGMSNEAKEIQGLIRGQGSGIHKVRPIAQRPGQAQEEPDSSDNEVDLKTMVEARLRQREAPQRPAIHPFGNSLKDSQTVSGRLFGQVPPSSSQVSRSEGFAAYQRQQQTHQQPLRYDLSSFAGATQLAGSAFSSGSTANGPAERAPDPVLRERERQSQAQPASSSVDWRYGGGGIASTVLAQPLSGGTGSLSQNHGSLGQGHGPQGFASGGSIVSSVTQLAPGSQAFGSSTGAERRALPAGWNPTFSGGQR